LAARKAGVTVKLAAPDLGTMAVEVQFAGMGVTDGPPAREERMVGIARERSASASARIEVMVITADEVILSTSLTW